MKSIGMRMPLKWGDRKLQIMQQQQLRWKILDVKMGRSERWYTLLS
jgi:hypothetical protein